MNKNIFMKNVNIKAHNGLFYQDLLLIDNMDDLNYYHENIYSNNIKDVVISICDKIKNNKLHCDNTIAEKYENVTNEHGSIRLLSKFTSRAIENRINAVLNGKILLINKNGGYFYLDSGDIIENINIKYTEKDIKITKFDGGKHFYATISGISVIDDEGNNKWNTHEYAHSVSVKYLEQLNK
jgi:hypothetical protein